MNTLGIDILTKDKSNLIRRLAALTTTESVCDGGTYHRDRSYSQVHLVTTWDEVQLDLWLYKTKGVDYVGTFRREAA